MSLCGVEQNIKYDWHMKENKIVIPACAKCFTLLVNEPTKLAERRQVIRDRLRIVDYPSYNSQNKKVYKKGYYKAPLAFSDDEFIETIESTYTIHSYNIIEKSKKKQKKVVGSMKECSLALAKQNNKFKHQLKLNVINIRNQLLYVS